ncbi:hypothetical protein EV401DRAFT_1894370 [Pisolithus croceorrhizus]|nr:hypothetical protein EV401DRAFT_1894370 [Pisolithus croceorrhizus]
MPLFLLLTFTLMSSSLLTLKGPYEMACPQCTTSAVNEEQKEILQTLEADEVLSQGRLVMFEQGSLDFVKHCMLTAMDVLDDKMMNKSCYLLMAQCQPPVPEPQMGHGNWNMSSQMSLIIS